jgi:hypothetical protein
MAGIAHDSKGRAGAEIVGDIPHDQLLVLLTQLMQRLKPAPSELDLELAALASAHGSQVYAELIFLLCHLRLEAGEARLCWREVVVTPREHAAAPRGPCGWRWPATSSR